MSRAVVCLAVLALLAVSAFAQGGSGVAAVIGSLSAYQTDRGGVAAVPEGVPTLEASENALFLNTLFGSNQVNLENVWAFLQSLENSDKGFSNTQGGESEVAAVRNLLLAYAHLDKKVSNPSGITFFIDSCFDKSTKLYGPSAGAAGDLQSTAYALQSLAQLGTLSLKTDIAKSIANSLAELVEENNGVKSFSASTRDNAFAIIAATLVSFEFGDDVQEWARYFYARQNADGGFNPTSETADTTDVSDAAVTLEALAALQKYTKSTSLIDAIDGRGLLSNVARLGANDVNAVAQGFKAVARTRQINDVFQSLLTVDTQDHELQMSGDRIVSGSKVKNLFVVRTAWGTPHNGFDVTLSTKYGKEVATSQLAFNQETLRYETDKQWETGSYLGKVTFEAAARVAIPDLGDDLTLRFSDTKTVGYDLDVVVRAVSNGLDVAQGDSVSQGATFTAEVALGTVANPKPDLLSGDFDVIFQVKDSSLVLIHESKVDGRKNKEKISFSYTLAKANIPAGTLTLSVSISNAAGTHSSEKVTYNLNVPMVASDIHVGSQSYKVGETVEVTMVPASLPDLRSVQAYSGYDFKQKQASRRFFMDVVSASGATISVVPGSSEFDDNDKLFYKFSVPLSSSIDSLGSPALRFRYATADGNSIPLQNFDSASGELYEANRALSYTVKADLRLKNFQSSRFPTDGKLNYGDNVLFSFQVVDLISGETLVGTGENTVYFALRSEDRSGSYISARVPAGAAKGEEEEAGDKFRVDWIVNPNAVKGKATLELLALGGDGKDVEITNEDGKPWRTAVNVGGELSIKETLSANAVVDPRTNDESAVFSLNFHLRSGETVLPGAKLFARVSNKKGAVLTAPVVEGKDADGEYTGYSVSWVLPNEVASAGSYKVDFFRESDRRRLAQKVDVEPFFTLTVPFDGAVTSVLPVRTEYLVLLVLGAAFVSVVFRKLETEGSRKSK